jgi:CO dehydrogenase maturation factor
MKNTRVFSFSGKGGTGKTTSCSLFLAALLRGKHFEEILVVDADPDANLSRTLGVSVEKTVGQIVDARQDELNKANAQGTKLRFALWDSISHNEAFDFLVMGRTTGDGCYCDVNAVLTENLVETMAMYDLIIIDFDAGLEHFSRGTGNPADTLVINCDPSQLSFDTAGRISELVEELALPYERLFLLGSRFPQEDESLFFDMALKAGIEPLGIIPYDREIAKRNLSGCDLLSLESGNSAVAAAEKILQILLGPALLI